MILDELQNGDAVYAAVAIINDGSVPGAEEGEIFALPGTVGMLINTGYFEDDPDETLYLVSFETASGDLGPPVTCLGSEIAPVAVV